MTLLLFLAVLFGALALGMPIAFALILGGAALMLQLEVFDAQLVAQNLIAGVDSYPLMAVPFFILAGELMNAGGLSRRIVALAIAGVGHVRGGLGYVVIATAMLLASLSGSAIADTAALTTLLLPMMRAHGYPLAGSAGLIAAGGIIAPIIPPSLPFILYGVSTSTSISSLFLAGIVPGLLMGMVLVLVWRRRLAGFGCIPQPPATARERRRALLEAGWALLLPVLILGGLRGGWFTPTEAAVVAAVYALVAGCVLYRELDRGALYSAFVRSARTTGVVMFLCAAATVSSYMITLAELPGQLAGPLAPLLAHPRLLMAVIVGLLLLVGMVMDLTPSILILAPVLLPLARSAGIDPVYFGVMFVLVGSIGLIAPRVRTVLTVAGGVGAGPLLQTVRGVLPYVGAYCALLGMFVLFPGLITAPLQWLR